MPKQRHDTGWKKRQAGRQPLPKLERLYERAKRHSPVRLPPFHIWLKNR